MSMADTRQRPSFVTTDKFDEPGKLERFVELATTGATQQGKASALPDEHVSPRLRLARRLDGHTAQMTVLALVLLDIMLIFGELLLVHACPKAKYTKHGHEDEKGEDRLHAVEESLFWLGITILIVLLAHQLILFACLGLEYLRHPLNCVDITALALCIILEIQLHNSESGVIVIALTWRVIRIFHGMSHVVETEKHKNEGMRKEIAKLKEENAALKLQLGAAAV